MTNHPWRTRRPDLRQRQAEAAAEPWSVWINGRFYCRCVSREQARRVSDALRRYNPTAKIVQRREVC